MFAYFYNKFRPVNCMLYIKCGVNSSLSTKLWLLQKVCGILEPCFILTHCIHNWGDLQIYSGVIFCEKGTTYRPMSHLVLYKLCPFSGWEKNTDSSELGGWFRWPVLVMAALESHNISWAALGLPTNLGLGRSWLFELLQSNSSPEGAWNLGGYI